LLALHAIAVFLGAALLFLIEPLAAKALLPRFGGSAGVWTASLVFYQTVLLGGYAYAHLLARRLSPRRMAILHAGVTVLAALLLPWHGPPPVDPGDALPAIAVLRALSSWIGVPFFVLAATGPLLQRWVAALPGARDPYPLYAVGNTSSLLALLSYPWLVERRLPLASSGGGDPEGGLTQNALWSGAFLVFVVLVVVCAAIASRAPRVDRATTDASPTPWRRRMLWMSLAFIPSAAMLGTTQALTTDVASVPLLWVLPLATYLVTFVVAFGTRIHVSSRIASVATGVLVLAVALSLQGVLRPNPRIALPLYLSTLLAVGMLCHGRLAEDRPPVPQLTDFYLSLAAGGALGSFFAGLLAPLLFTSILEFPLALVLACLALSVPPLRSGSGASPRSPFEIARRGLPAIFATAVAILFARATSMGPLAADAVHVTRTFFGVLRVKEEPGPPFVPQSGPNAGHEVRLPMRELYHGTTLHGVQITRASQARMPTTYYHPTGPIGRLFAALRAFPGRGPLSEVGIVGLGVGSLAAYAQAGEHFTFFEIDPAVVRIARDPSFFSFLKDSPGRIDIVVEDGRIALAAQPDAHFDLVVVDAFSSDAVPVHLLTREALALALRKLKPGGFLAYHLSSSFFDLAPVVAETAASLGKQGLFWLDATMSPIEVVTLKQPSRWVVVAPDAGDLEQLAGAGKWEPLASVRRTDGGPWLWTDRYSSPLAALRRRADDGR
jgi:hypothetical protein